MLARKRAVPREEGAKAQTVSGCGIARVPSATAEWCDEEEEEKHSLLAIQKDMPLLLVPPSPGKQTMKEEAASQGK